MRRKTPRYKSGTLFVISAPSGAGKTTLCRELLKKNRNLKLSVSYTTRQPRKGEKDDIHYSFVTERKFKNMIEKGEFAEWAAVHGNFYGTSLKRLKKLSKEGYDIILDIDVHGATQMRRKINGALYIFVLPPSMAVLKKRLINRKTESEDKVKIRLNKAKEEIASYRDYDYLVVNDKIEKAYRELEGIITSAKLRTQNIDHKWVKENLLN